MEFRRHTFENGLEIVAECNDEAISTALGVFVSTGARDETDAQSGVSHFLEHMCFKGTPRRTADDVNREFDEIGAHYNAFTSEESTVYYATVLPEYQEACIDLLADIVRPSLREDDFDVEKKVILEEIQMYLDQPPYGMDDRIKELHLGVHPLTRRVLGTAESIEALSADQMRSYFDARYGPENLVIGAAGKVDFAALVDQVAARCEGWQRIGATRDTGGELGHPGFECIHRPTASQQYVLQLSVGPSVESDERFAAKLLSTIIGDDSGSRMYWELVDPGLADTASLGHYDYVGLGMFYMWMSCHPEEAQANLQRLQDIYRSAEQDGVTAEELSQAKSKVKSRVVLGSERPRSRMFHVGGNWMQRREYRSVSDDLAELDSVTLEDIQGVLTTYPLSQHTTLTVGPAADLKPAT